MDTFKGFLLKQNEETGAITGTTETLPFSYLKEKDVLVKVHYSSINYKDYLATKARSGVVFQYPIIPGIDLAGVIVKSNTPEFNVGDKIIATSYDLGTKTDGGLAEYAFVDKNWIIKLPENLSLKEAMTYGTAGFTSALAIKRLLNHGISNNDSIAITGATGGVGSISSLLLEKLGYKKVTLFTQKPENSYVQSLPHETILSSKNLLEEKKKALDKQQYNAVIDTVGGEVLGHLLSKICYNGAVCSIGNTGGIGLETTVLPFILRNINLYGVDSVETPYPLRKEIWDFMANEGKIDFSKLKTIEIPFEQLHEAFQLFEEGKHIGRIIISF